MAKNKRSKKKVIIPAVIVLLLAVSALAYVLIADAPAGDNPPPVDDGEDPVDPGDDAPICVSLAKSLLDPKTVVKDGKNREQLLDSVHNSMMSDGRVIQLVSCSLGECMWTPWFKSSDNCQASNLQAGNNCKLGSITLDSNCMVTDEFSQGFMIVSQSKNQQMFRAGMNTIKLIRSTRFGSTPVWRVSRVGSNINPGYTGNQDDASDATARVIIALVTGANNPYFDAETRKMARDLAKEMGADFVENDYYDKCYKTTWGREICHWYASGGDAGNGGFAWNNYAYGGYGGDIAIANIGLYELTGDKKYADYFYDTVGAYLAGAKFDGQHFSIAPFAWNWQVNNGVVTPVCSRGCTSDGWQSDGADQIRWTTICKANYYAAAVGLDPDPDLAKYCADIPNHPWYDPVKWQVQHKWPDDALGGWNSGYAAEGLGSSINFYVKQEHLAGRMDSAMKHYSFNTGTFDNQECLGLYFQAFPIINYGSAIGRDFTAFGAVSTGTEVCT